MFDIIIQNGFLVSGAGNPWFKANVAIKDGKILRLGRIGSEGADKTINAEGLIVCPGFIDIHSHSEFTLLANPKAESKIRQGVTTEVVGNCGSSAAPLNEATKEDLRKSNHLIEEAGIKLDWETLGEYLDHLRRSGVALNVASLVGHGTVRAYVMGYEKRPPSRQEMEEMKAAVEGAMKEGAYGMSSGLIYPPSSYASTDELVELCRVVAKNGGIYTSHIRGEAETLLEAVEEAIFIGTEAKLPVEINHHKAMGTTNWGKVTESLSMIEEARGRGVDVTCDVYPYVAASFGLRAMLPPWTHEGGVGKMVERLKDPEARARMERDMTTGLPDWSSPLRSADWGDTLVTGCRSHPAFEGKMMVELAEKKGVSPFMFTFDLLIEEAGVTVVRFAMREEDVRTVMRHPIAMVGTDGYSFAPYGVLGKGKPHPRSYGTFPRILGKYVRDEHLLTLEEAVRKMTSLPARRLRLKQRGLILEGMWADIAIFNPKEIRDRATFTDPHQYPEGIEYVLVNGKVVVERGEHTGTLAGKVLNLQEELR